MESEIFHFEAGNSLTTFVCSASFSALKSLASSADKIPFCCNLSKSESTELTAWADGVAAVASAVAPANMASFVDERFVILFFMVSGFGIRRTL